MIEETVKLFFQSLWILVSLLYVERRKVFFEQCCMFKRGILLLPWQRQHSAILLWEVQLQETESPGFVFSGVHYKWLWLTDVLSVQRWMSTLCPGSPSPSCLFSTVRAKPGHTSLIAYFGRNLLGREARKSSTLWLRCSLMHQDTLIMSATLMGKKVNKCIEKKKWDINTHVRVHCSDDLICRWNKGLEMLSTSKEMYTLMGFGGYFSIGKQHVVTELLTCQ